MSLYRIKGPNDGEIPGRHTGEQHVYLLCKVVGLKYCNRNPNTIFQMNRMMLTKTNGNFVSSRIQAKVFTALITGFEKAKRKQGGYARSQTQSLGLKPVLCH